MLHDAESILMLVGSTDGSDDGYLVPGYRFTGDDGTVVDQMAIVEDALEPVDVPDDTPTGPVPDPATGSGSTSGSPGAAGGGSPGYDPGGSVSSPVQPAPGTNAPDHADDAVHPPGARSRTARSRPSPARRPPRRSPTGPVPGGGAGRGAG